MRHSLLPYHLKRLTHTLIDIRRERPTVTMAEWFQRADRASATLIVRCDVERRTRHALRFAQELARRDIYGTWYFHTRSNCYHVERMQAIQQLGHEIGYHHECLDRCGGDFAGARELFLREVTRFRDDGFDLQTVCSHGESGLPRQGYAENWDLLVHYPELLAEAGLQGEVYTTFMQAHQPACASDTFTAYRRFWRNIERGNRLPKPLQILIHPHRWHDWPLPTVQEVARDLAQRYANKALRGRRYATIWDKTP